MFIIINNSFVNLLGITSIYVISFIIWSLIVFAEKSESLMYVKI
jgi:hypothetical protein